MVDEGRVEDQAGLARGSAGGMSLDPKAQALLRVGEMAAAQPQGLDRQGVCSLEVRWILPGRLAAKMTEWFGRFPAETKVLEDAYLLDPHLPGLSVKVRERRALEVKQYRGSPGLLEVAGRARGRLESWRKWAFPHDPPVPDGGDSAGWRPVSKRRRISWLLQATGVGVLGLGEEPGCAVELTEIHVRGEAWWTLGFEATGPAAALGGELDAAAALVFAQALPDGVELGMDDSKSYAQWLRRRPGANDTGAFSRT